MIPLDEKQQKALHAITHDLMLLSSQANSVAAEFICDVLGVLYSGLLKATEEEVIAASVRGDTAVRNTLGIEASEGAFH